MTPVQIVKERKAIEARIKEHEEALKKEKDVLKALQKSCPHKNERARSSPGIHSAYIAICKDCGRIS